MDSTNSSKLKSYLIDKLLNESASPVQTTTKASLSPVESMKQRAESKEDLVSEAGTYTIDDSPDADTTNDLDHVENTKTNILRQSTNTNVDLISARAAIDETFGIKRPQINDAAEADLNSTIKSDSSKRSAQKTNRARNKTYSLTKDLLVNRENIAEKEEDKGALKPPNCAFSTSSSSSISSYNDSESKLKKTTT